MTEELKKNGIIEKRGFSEAELAELRELAAVVEKHDSLLMKVNWDVLTTREGQRTDDYFYYLDGQLVGFLGIYHFNPWEAEISGMVHPEHRRKGLFTELLERAKAELDGRGDPNILFIVQNDSATGQAFVKTLGAKYHHSEFRMERDPSAEVPVLPERLELRPARLEDVEDLGRMTSVCFNMPLEEMTSQSRRHIEEGKYRYLVALLDGERIGRINVDVPWKEYAFIFGFAVLPEHQGKGYGREILARTLRQCVEEGRTDIALEVAVENAALGLYESVGFRVVSGYDYYAKSYKTETE